jgi:hypothetical protein
MQFLEVSWDFGILGFSKILGFLQRFSFGIFDEVYEDFQSNLPLGPSLETSKPKVFLYSVVSGNYTSTLHTCRYCRSRRGSKSSELHC